MMKTARSFKTKNKGQSFIELAILMSTLLLLVVGLVEFGNMLNQYINIVDGAREGARFASNTDPFYNTTTHTYDYSTVQSSFYESIDSIIEGNTAVDPKLRTSAITPLTIDTDTPGIRTNGVGYKAGDVLITFYSIADGTIVRKWPTWDSHGSGQVSQIPDSEVTKYLYSEAPSTGIVLIEIFYNYRQLLKLPIFTLVIADPIPVHSYAFMPLAAAESTPTPCGC